MGEDEHVALDRPQAGNDAVGAGADLRHRLAARAAVAEQLPVGALLVDVGGRPAFVGAVVPLEHVGVDTVAIAAEAG